MGANHVRSEVIRDLPVETSEDDELGHQAIAAEVARLAVETEDRLNIALFGPWGSGKSSFGNLLGREFEGRYKGKVEFARYDAWKFDGQPLHRNFITTIANELQVRDWKFGRGLYEEQRTGEIHTREFLRDFTKKWGRGAVALVGLFAGLIFVALLVLILAAVLTVSGQTEDGFWTALLESFVQIGPELFVGTGLLVLALLAIDTFRVEHKQPPPDGSEQFASLFGELIDQALGRAKDRRLVVFIDELDRCSPGDVVETLQSLQTFFNIDRCVFVLAADREVLEEDLKRRLRQATPIRSDEPYYTMASAFIDKAFQHQFTLPPLRPQSLTRFARDLVKDRDGVWHELDSRDEDGRALEGVLYALIPAHVRSPRRVKVLLNNFVTNYRVAKARNVSGLEDRAPELAKLTVLQTEFPAFARELYAEPRLPTLLFTDDLESLPPRQRERVERNRLPEDMELWRVELQDEPDTDEIDALTQEDASSSDGVQPTDRVLARGRADEDEQTLNIRSRWQLRRYLERVDAASIKDPGRDLLYIEHAKEFEGLTPELVEVLEEYARDTPDQAIDRVHAAEEFTKALRVNAACFLAEQAEVETFEERLNFLSVAAQLIAPIEPEELQSSASQLGRSIDGVAKTLAQQRQRAIPGMINLSVADPQHGSRLAESAWGLHEKWLTSRLGL